MKRSLLILLSCAILITVAACNNKAATGETIPSTPPATSTPSETPSVGESSVEQGDSNILIAYFAVAENSEVDAVSSASVFTENSVSRGYVRVLADAIQNEVGGDVFSIQTSVEYPAGIDEVIDFAAKEQKEKTRPELTSSIENFDSYDTVFIGFPNWWYDMPMVMYSFFEEYDFSGKTIIPFCTHNGSGFSSTIATIRELEPNATVITDGFTVNFKNAAKADEDVTRWLEKLEL